ncbi:pseudouridine synthase [Xanthobacter dioxanivorans]|uniref:Pseudouridine synthase n=1 Tax=Xanthobacter dioxanivorans TaxID=2528964 RepID=A0A974SJK0_9HYPH|nr:pseudouridine synthase [Xanthobacter dioxanivorans]QRG06488.1 pseudouridine synthase [Xanthobacter dioxanivorans]
MPRTSPPRKDKNRVPRQKRELPAATPKEGERVAKVVARAGLGSRREIEEWIEAGRVAVNGEVLTAPGVTVTAADAITIDGEPLPERERTRLFLYHKPKGVVTTNRDPEGRTTLFEILPKGLPRLVSVGRLDLNSEGLLLLTNDGGLARVLELPETGWLRRYRVRANGEVDQAKLDALLRGVTVDGVEYGPIEAELDRVQGANAWITVSLREGKNREIRNVLGALGLQVNRLIRVSYGPFQLGEIAEGGIEEVRTRVLRDQIGADLAAAAGADFTGLLVEREVEEVPVRPAYRPAGKKQAAAEKTGGLKVPGRRAPRDAGFDAPEADVIRPAEPRARRRMSDDNAVESRGSVADRKGRTVKVERVVASKSDAPARGARPGVRKGDDARPPRRGRDEAGFERPQRGTAGAKGRPSGRPSFRSDERGPRRDAEGKEDFRRRPTRSGPEGEERPRRPRPDGPPRSRERDEVRPSGPRHERGAERPRRYEDEGGVKRSGPRRAEGDKPFRADRPQGDRPIRTRSDRPEGRSGGDYGDKPRARSFGDKPAGRAERSGEKPFRSDRPEGRSGGDYGDKPRARSFGDKPAGRAERSGDKPFRSERPQGDRPVRARSDRPEGRSGGDYGDKPRGRSFGDKPAGKAGGRPGGFGGKPGGKPSGGRPAGGKPGGRPGGKPAAPRGKR